MGGYACKDYECFNEDSKSIAVDGGPSLNTATIIYTSGTTSYPKGVALSHQSILHQIRRSSFSVDGGGSVNSWDPKLVKVNFLPTY